LNVRLGRIFGFGAFYQAAFQILRYQDVRRAVRVYEPWRTILTGQDLDPGLVGTNLARSVMVGRTASLDDIPALPAFHLKNRGVDVVPGKISHQTDPRKPSFHEPSLPIAQAVAVPGFHSGRISGPGRGATLDLLRD